MLQFLYEVQRFVFQSRLSNCLIDVVLNKPQRFSLRESIDFKPCKREIVLARSSTFVCVMLRLTWLQLDWLLIETRIVELHGGISI
jgi:hypothetical protein